MRTALQTTAVKTSSSRVTLAPIAGPFHYAAQIPSNFGLGRLPCGRLSAVADIRHIHSTREARREKQNLTSTTTHIVEARASFKGQFTFLMFRRHQKLMCECFFKILLQDMSISSKIKCLDQIHTKKQSYRSSRDYGMI